MNFYWVNIGTSKKEVREFHYLWAPTHTYVNGGRTKTINAGWKHMPNVRSGDILFCHFEKKIQFVAVARKNPYLTHRPTSRKFDKWKNEGYKIEVELFVLSNPISRDEFKDDINKFYNEYCSPKLIADNGNISQQYLFFIPVGLGLLILDSIGDTSIKIQDEVRRNKNSGVDNKKKINKTTKESIIKARVGQGTFRNEVLGLWNNSCPVTKVDNKELLIASHIVSWQLSNDEEKLDKYNGLPLSPSIDKLFDRGYVSFSDNGELLLNDRIDPNLIKKLGIPHNAKIYGLQAEHKIYLKRHREIYNINTNSIIKV